MLITYGDSTYQIQNSDTNMKYVYWDITNPYTLQCFNKTQPQSPGMFQVFINENGIATERSHEGLVVTWDGNNSDLISKQIFGLHESNKQTGNKFVAIETDIDGIKQTVGNTQTTVDSHTEKISKIEQKADEIGLSVGALTQEFSDDKVVRELRENLNKSMIDYNSSLGIFKSEIYTYYKDNKIDSVEKTKIDSHLDLMDNKRSEVNKYVDIVIVMMREEGQTTQVNRLNSAKTKFVNSTNNLRTYITTAISDNTIVPSEITGITDLFAKCSVAINELKNVCDDCIFLGSGGKITEELARIGIKSDEIVLSVSKTEETIKSNLSIEKNLLQGNINDFKNATSNLEKALNSAAKDGGVTPEEIQIINNAWAEVSVEKADIENKYNDLYNNIRISASSKNTLKIEYDKFNAKFIEVKTKIDDIVSDGFFNDAEKIQIDTLMNELSSCLTNLHPTMSQALDNIQLNTSRAEIESAKNELQGNINDVIGRVDGLNDYVNGTFENNVLDEAERKAIKSNLDTLAREKVDIDNQYTQLNSNSFLTGILKTNYVTSYNNFISKYNALVDIINGILAKTELINNSDRDNMNTGYNQLNEALGVFVKLSNEVIEYIAKKEAENIKNILNQDILDVDKKIDDLTSDINSSFKDNIIDESERNLITANLKDLETQKIDVDNQFNQLILSKFLDGNLKVEFQSKYDDLTLKYSNLVNVMNGILDKQDLINNLDRDNLNAAKDTFNISIGEFSRVVNEVIEYIGKKQSESAVGDFSGQLDALSKKVDTILDDVGGAISDGILDEAERISISQSLKSIEDDFTSNEIEFQKVYNNPNLVGNVKTELNTVFNTYKTKYQELVNTINYLLNKIGDIDEVDRERLNVSHVEYRDSVKVYLSKFYEAMDSITNKGINDAKNELNKEINDLTSSLNGLEETMIGVFKDGILSDAEKVAIKQNLQTIELEKIDIDKSYLHTYNHSNLIGSSKIDLKNTYDAYVANHNNLVTVINTILNKVGIIDSVDQGNLTTSLSNYKTSLSEYKIKYNVAVDSITNKGINDAKNEMQEGINDLNGALGDLENTMNNAFKDGVLSDAEKLSMKQHLQTIAKEKTDVDNQYNSVYTNADLLGNAKSNLKTSYDDYNAKYNSLVTVIDDILNKVGLIDSTDQNNLNNAFSNYRTSSGVYSKRVNEAIDSIAKTKADNAQNESKKFTEAQIKVVNDAINLKVSQEEYNGNNVLVNKKFSEIDQTVDSIGLEVNSVKNTYNNNLLMDSNFKSFGSGWNLWKDNGSDAYIYKTRHWTELQEGVGIANLSSDKYCEFQSNSVIANKGEEFTLSFDILVEYQVKQVTVKHFELDENGNPISFNTIDCITDRGADLHKSYSFTVQDARTKYIRIIFAHEGSNDPNGWYVFFLNRVQLERGNVETNWKAMQGQVSLEEISKIEIDKESIKQTVEKHQNDLNWLGSESSRIEQKANQVQATVTNIQGDYVGQSQLTQTVNGFEFNVANMSQNLLYGSSFNNTTRHWYTSGYRPENAQNLRYRGEVGGDWGIPGIGRLTIQGDYGVGFEYGVTQDIQVSRDTNYTFTCYVAAHRARGLVVVRGSDNNWIVNASELTAFGGTNINNWTKVTLSFNTARHTTIKIQLSMHAADADGYVWYTMPMLNRGSKAIGWSQNPNEVTSGIVMIDSEGVRVNHSSGDFSQMTSQGFKRHRSSGDAKGDYHYLTQYIGFSGMDTVWVQLKDDFRGKNFTAYSVMSDTWEGSWEWGQPWVVQRFVTYVQTDQIDYNNARVPVLIYRIDKNYQTNEYRKMPCAGILLVVG